MGEESKAANHRQGWSANVHCNNKVKIGETVRPERFVIQYKNPETCRLEYLSVEAASVIDAVDECARIVRSRCALPHAQVSVIEVRSLRSYQCIDDESVEQHLQGIAASMAAVTGCAVIVAMHSREENKTYTACSGHLDSKETIRICHALIQTVLG